MRSLIGTGRETRRDPDGVRRGAYTGKARHVAILQDDRFDATASMTVCAFTTDPTPAPLFRPEL